MLHLLFVEDADLENAQTVKVHVARMRHKLESACPGRAFVGIAWKHSGENTNYL